MDYDLNEFNPIKFKKKYIISNNGNNNESSQVGVLNFDILSSSKEIRSPEFELVDDNFLSSKNIDESLYTNKYVFNFEIDGKIIFYFQMKILYGKKKKYKFKSRK